MLPRCQLGFGAVAAALGRIPRVKCDHLSQALTLAEGVEDSSGVSVRALVNFSKPVCLRNVVGFVPFCLPHLGRP